MGKMERKDEYVKKLKLWFCAIDNDCTGSITYDQFERNANSPEVHAFAEALDIELLDLKQFFTVLSANNKRSVNFDTGCIKLKGMEKSMDLMDLIYTQKTSFDEHRRQMDLFEKHVIMEFLSIR